MNFFYAQEFQNLSVSCPPEHYKAKNMTVYRWVFEDINDERNFTPRYFLAPKRDLEKIEQMPNDSVKDNKKCDMLALSFFESEQCAQNRISFIQKGFRKFLGTHIAKCNITIDDGLNGEPDERGHFNHHPDINAKNNFKTRFQIIASIP